MLIVGFAILFSAATPASRCVSAEKPQKLSWAKEDLPSSSGRPIWINLWGDFCKPCIDEFPRVKKLAKELGFTLVFIGMVNDTKIDYTKKFGLSDPKNHMYSFTVDDEKDRLAGLFDPSKPFSFPQQFFFDKEQNLRCKMTGSVDGDDTSELKKIFSI